MGRQASGAQFNVSAVGTAATGHYAYYLLDPTGGSCAIQSCSLSVDAPADDKTANGDTAKTFGTLRKSHTWNISARYPKATRKLGHAGLLTLGSGSLTVARCTSFSLSIDWGENDCTPLDYAALSLSGSEKWHMYLPKYFPTVTGSFTGIRDASTAEVETFFEGDTAAGMTYRLEDVATDSTIAFSTISNARTWEADIPGDGPQTYGYSFNASGAITIAGTNAILPAGALAAQVCTDSSGVPDQTITAFASGTTNKTVAYVYLRRMNIEVPATGPIIVTAELRGTGPLTEANS